MSTAAGPPGSDVRAWTAFCPSVAPDRILRVHGYKDATKVRPILCKTAAEAARRITGIAEPEVRWRRLGIERLGPDGVAIEGGIAFRCEAFARLLAGADQVIAFVLTLGARLDAEVTALFGSDNPLDALFMETAGWLAVERLTRELGGHLRTELAPEGRGIGHRMGPGYSYATGDRATGRRVMWPLEQQHELFRAFAGATMPVALLESAAMQPRMSRSGLFAVLPGAMAATCR